jgi:DNA (cytosine-5)-methyltransferase 1
MISSSEQNGQNIGNKSVGKVKSAAPTRVIDLCCGLGGLSLAARQVGMGVLAGVDRSPTALKTFGRNFPEAEAIEGSVRSRTVLKRCRELSAPTPKDRFASVILSGPPCQGFSAAGSRDPKDIRNKVLVAVARAIAELQPKCAIIENVSMVLAEKHGARLDTFEEVLVEGGYKIARVLLDASEFGVCQKRKRAFFYVTKTDIEAEDILRRLVVHKLAAKGAEEALRGLPVPAVRPDDYDDEKDYADIANHLAMDHSQGVKEKIAAIAPGTGPMSYRRLHPTRPSNTLFSGHRAAPAHFSEPRSITVREAARLQGFPDDFRVYGAFANQMEQVTNAVPPPLACAVLRVLSDVVKLI